MKRVLCCVCAALLWAGTSQARAAVIRSPDAIIATDIAPFNSNWDMDFIINGSGLPSFTSGTTDFAAYIASNPVHAAIATTTGWAGQSGVTTGDVDFDLGSPQTIEELALWTVDNEKSIGDFTVFTSTDASFTTPTNVGSFSAIATFNAQTFDLTDTTAQYVRVSITSNLTGTNLNWGEIAFATSSSSQSATPEPSAFVLAVIALLGIRAFRGRGRRK